MKKITLTDRLRYQFDALMSRGTAALIAWLALLSLILIVMAAFAVWATGVGPAAESGERPAFGELAWMSLLRTLDPGTMGGDTGSVPFLLAMLAVTKSTFTKSRSWWARLLARPCCATRTRR